MAQHSTESSHGLRRINTLLNRTSRGIRCAVLATLGVAALVAAKPTTVAAQTIDSGAMQHRIAALMQQSGGAFMPVAITHTDTATPIATITPTHSSDHTQPGYVDQFDSPSMGQLFAKDAKDPPVVHIRTPDAPPHGASADVNVRQYVNTLVAQSGDAGHGSKPNQTQETGHDTVRTIESPADQGLRISFLNGTAPKMWESHGFFVTQEFRGGNIMLGNDIGQRIILSNKQAAKYLLGKKVTEVKIAFADPTTVLSVLKGAAETVVLVGTMGQSVIVTASELATGTNAALKGISYGLRSAGLGHYLPNVSGMIQQAGQYIDQQITPQHITAEDIIAATHGVNVGILNQLPDELVQQLGRAGSEDQKKKIIAKYLQAHAQHQSASAANTTSTENSSTIAEGNTHTASYMTPPMVTPLGGAKVVSGRQGNTQSAAYYGSKVAIGWHDQHGDGPYAGVGGVAVKGVPTTANEPAIGGSDVMLHSGYQFGTRELGPVDASAQVGVIAEQVTIDNGSQNAIKPTFGARGDITRAASEAGIGGVIRGGGITLTMDHSFTGAGNSLRGDIRVGSIALSKGPLMHTIGVDFSENPFDVRHKQAAYTRLLEKIQSANNPQQLSHIITTEILPGTGRRRISPQQLKAIKAQADARAALLQPRAGAEDNSTQDDSDRDALRRNFEISMRNAEKAQLNPYQIDDPETLRQLATYASRPTAESQRVLTAFIQYRIAELSSTADNIAMQRITDGAAFRPEPDVRTQATQIAARLDSEN